MKEERFLHLGKPPHWQVDLPGQKGSIRPSEENISSRFAAARAEGELHRRSVPLPCTPQPDTCWQGLGAGTRALEIRTGERTGDGCVERATWAGNPLRLQRRVYAEEAWATLLASRHGLEGAEGERMNPDCSLSTRAHAHSGQDIAYTGSGGSREPPLLPAQMPGAVTSPPPPPSQTPGVSGSRLGSHRVLQGHA